MRSFYSSSEVYLGFLRRHDEGYLRPYVELVDRFAGRGSLILDLGCGNGLSSAMLARRGHRVVGVDISPLFLRDGLRWAGPGLTLLASDAEQLPFKDDSFDLVCSNELVEHLTDVERALSEMARVVRPGGRIIISAPNLCSPILPFLDLMRIVRGEREKAVWAMSVGEALKLIVKNSLISLKKHLSSKPNFIYRRPDLFERVVGGDADSSYLASPRDLERFFKSRGLAVERRCVGMGLWGRLFSKLIPSLWIHISMVIRKAGR